MVFIFNFPDLGTIMLLISWTLNRELYKWIFDDRMMKGMRNFQYVVYTLEMYQRSEVTHSVQWITHAILQTEM